MQGKHSHTLFIAHSNKNYVLGLSIELTKNGYLIESQAVSGIEALEYVIQYQPKVAVIEAELPLLSAYDIIKTAKSKEIKTQFIVVLKAGELPMLRPLQYVKVNEVYYCNMSFKISNKVLSGLYKPKNWFWRCIELKFQKSNTKTIKTVETFLKYDCTKLLSLTNTQYVAVIKDD
ncbi:hypothetical protein [Polaribacter sp. 20A6]|uniref:hypothetical protein n=1 Tax=Polaribacter sp. 20A6 TaxID=2687289 RepID=UPI0013FD3E53|nr:hypothetical protein [Polaribacter sp. 20A6]